MSVPGVYAGTGIVKGATDLATAGTNARPLTEHEKRPLPKFVRPTEYGSAMSTDIGVEAMHTNLGLSDPTDPRILEALKASQGGVYDASQQLAALAARARGEGLQADLMAPAAIGEMRGNILSAASGGRGGFDASQQRMAQQAALGIPQQLSAPMAMQRELEQQRAQQAYAKEAARIRALQEQINRQMIDAQRSERNRALQEEDLRNRYLNAAQRFKRGVESQEATGMAQTYYGEGA